MQKSLLNVRINMICYFVSLAVAFFTRKVFLDYLGTHFIGFTTTLQSLLGFLNLAELGVGTAIGYLLYKPIFDGDKAKINEIISVFGYIYRWIGRIILGVGIVISFFLPLIFPDTPFSWGIIYLGFYAYLFASLLSYFVNYRMVLLSADQRNYIVTGYFQLTSTIKIIVQVVLAIYLTNFCVYLLIEVLFGIINSSILNYKINKTYPWLESDVKQGRKLFKKYPEIGTYVKQLFVHKIGGFVQFQLSPFMIYSFVSLPVVALYGNYTLVTQRMQSFVNGTLDSVGAGIGSLISEGNRDKIYETYKELFSVRLFVAITIATSIYHLVSPFIAVWLGSEYILPNTVVFLIALQAFMALLRGTTDQFLHGYGLFYDIWAPLTESALFVVFSIIGGLYGGLAGVLAGPLVSTLVIIHIWKPYFLYHKGFKRPFIGYTLNILLLVPLILVYFVTVELADMIIPYESAYEGWVNWITASIVYVVLYGIISFAMLYAISPGMRRFVLRFVKSKKV